MLGQGGEVGASDVRLDLLLAIWDLLVELHGEYGGWLGVPPHH